MTARFVDGTELRATEVRRTVPELRFELAGLPAGYSTSTPEPEQCARDMVMAVDDGFPCFAEATDLVTMEGNSLRLDLDSENESRFCRWLRETPVRLILCVALRTSADAAVQVFHASCDGRIADKPAGPRALGWDRLFVPAGFDVTYAELVADPAAAVDAIGLRAGPYRALLAAMS
ncbi:MAG: hypothetical protein IPH80_04935 [Myxococcales bacterium]|nr:hypothetical protein [Myxococcales bacterium]MBP6842284.1 hypothetical protein [Kofleriaceae bacterium]